MEHDLEIEYDKVVLRPMNEEDSERYRVLRNKSKQFFFNNKDISKEDNKRWFKSYLNRKDEYMFSIYTNENRFIGGLGLYDFRQFDTGEYGCEFGRIVISSECRHGGYGIDSVKAAIVLGKDKLKLKNIWLYVREDNVAAIKTYKKAGFTLEHVNEKKEYKGTIEL